MFAYKLEEGSYTNEPILFELVDHAVRGWSGLFTNAREWTRFVGGIDQL